jgi:hypothetical protein
MMYLSMDADRSGSIRSGRIQDATQFLVVTTRILSMWSADLDD